MYFGGVTTVSKVFFLSGNNTRTFRDKSSGNRRKGNPLYGVKKKKKKVFVCDV